MTSSFSTELPPPALNIVIQVVGSRGDVQPFVALGKALKEQYNHRVRLATHATFKGFVEENGLEFFNIGGDPAALMAFMVKNPGLMPGFDSLRHGDVGKRQREIFDILLGCWRSCIEAGDGMDLDFSEDQDGGQSRPFVADAIIANPPSFAHIHCAEKLGVPVHLMFTMPWSPTQAFPHPLANVQSSNADPHLTNLISYTLVEALTWQGLGHVINRFREQNLRLDPVSLMYAPSILNRLHIPYTYCWSPALIPKPKDWGSNISISGFYFLSLASTFTPSIDLQEFLDAGPPPVYIGFGSIVVDDPDAMTAMIFEAIKKAGVRALVSKGWGGIGKGDMAIPERVFMLGNTPHDWLFKRVSCVVHHGGAGTTAAGIALGKPTVVVPFFGDQPFWGAMIARAGAGPIPIPYKKLTAEILAASIAEALQPAVQQQATVLAASIAQEEGTENGANFFHCQLDLDTMRCSLAPTRVAVWRVRRTQVRLSALAATVLANEGLVTVDDLKLYRPQEYDVVQEPSDPISGTATGVLGAMADAVLSVTNIPIETIKAVRSADQERRGRKKPSNRPLATGHSATTLTSALTTPSGVLALSPDKSDASSSILTSQTTISSRFSEQTLLNDRDDFDMVHDTSTQEISPGQDGETFSNEAGRRSITNNLSGVSVQSSSAGSTLSGSSTQAPIGSRKMEIGPGERAGRFLGGTLRSPMDFTFTLARGFHNAPKLYGDTTVRRMDKVIDLQSGLKMAGKVCLLYSRTRFRTNGSYQGLGYGLYDGLSGLVTQPINGAKGEGVAGFIKGVGKGLGGVVLKPCAGKIFT